MKEQSIKFGTTVITETISKVDFKSRPFKLWREGYEEEEVLSILSFYKYVLDFLMVIILEYYIC